MVSVFNGIRQRRENKNELNKRNKICYHYKFYKTKLKINFELYKYRKNLLILVNEENDVSCLVNHFETLCQITEKGRKEGSKNETQKVLK